MRHLVLWLATCVFVVAAELAKTHRDFRLAAEAAYAAKDFAAARDAYAAALVLRPDSPRYLHNYAATCALTGRPDDALATLRQLAALGIVTRVERDNDLASLRERPEFAEILRLLASNRAPRGRAEPWAELPAVPGIVEGLAYRAKTGDLFLSDVHRRGIWRRDRAGKLSRFSVDDPAVLGLFGLAIDETRSALWAATAALPEMDGFTAAMKGRAGLAEFDLVSGSLRRVILVPADGRDHVLGDLTLDGDGAIYATDSVAPVIWRLAPDGGALERWVESPTFASLQGLALFGRKLLGSDYANGLVVVDLATRAVRPLAPPVGATLLGLDGFVRMGDAIVGIQNGVSPSRVIRVRVAPDLASVQSVEVLAAALPGLDDLSLITLVDGQPTFIAGAGWDNFDAGKSPHPTAHGVRILQVGAVPH